MSNHHTVSHEGHGGGHEPSHPQDGEPMFDHATATALYEAQGVVYQWIDTIRHELHQLPDHDTAALQRCDDSLLQMVASVGTICGYLGHHTDGPLYALCYEFSQHAYSLIDQWKAEYEHGGAAAVQHSGEDFFDLFRHTFDMTFALTFVGS